MEDKTDIQFTCAYLSFLNTFAFETNKDINSENAIKKLRHIGIKARSSDQYLEHFKIAESFHLPKSITQQEDFKFRHSNKT